jgi:chromosome segregation ATPase
MAAWLVPVLKAALPYVSNIVAAAVPVFTNRKVQDGSAELVSLQIDELQKAVTGNAEAVKGLAAQVEKTITALGAGEADLAQRLATLHEALARCESSATLAQAQVTRVEGVAAALQARVEEFEPRMTANRRRELPVAVVAVLALVVAIIALLR